MQTRFYLVHTRTLVHTGWWSCAHKIITCSYKIMILFTLWYIVQTRSYPKNVYKPEEMLAYLCVNKLLSCTHKNKLSCTHKIIHCANMSSQDDKTSPTFTGNIVSLMFDSTWCNEESISKKKKTQCPRVTNCGLPATNVNSSRTRDLKGLGLCLVGWFLLIFSKSWDTSDRLKTI